MYFYKIYDQTIQIDKPLYLPSISQQSTDYKIFVLDDSLSTQTATWIHNYAANNDAPLHRLGKLGADYLVRFAGCADFVIEEENGIIRCFPTPSAASNTIEHLLLNQLLPRLLDRKHFMALHAGGAVYKKGAVGFVGKTGSGKSTLTAYLGKHGYPVITDDCLVLQKEHDRLLALPSYPTIRLHVDSAERFSAHTDDLPHVAGYSGKLRIDPEQGTYSSHARPETLCALFVLNEPDPTQDPYNCCIERCTMRQAFGLLIGHTFRLDPSDKQSSVREFNSLKNLVSKIPVYRLNYARSYDLLGDVVGAALELVSPLE